jgi:uncharacterized protein Yka (UPF0111/DUF47 family)
MRPNFTGVYFRPRSVLELFDRVDEIANRAERFCGELAAMHPTLSTDEQGVRGPSARSARALPAVERADLVRMADLVVEGMEVLATAVTDLCSALCAARPDTDVQSAVARISRLESACDATRDKLLSDVFAGTPTVEALVVKELVDTLDGAMDAVEDAADHLGYVDSTMVDPTTSDHDATHAQE